MVLAGRRVCPNTGFVWRLVYLLKTRAAPATGQRGTLFCGKSGCMEKWAWEIQRDNAASWRILSQTEGAMRACCVRCRARGMRKSRPAAPSRTCRDGAETVPAWRGSPTYRPHRPLLHNQACVGRKLSTFRHTPSLLHCSIYHPKCLQCEGQRLRLLDSPSIPCI